MADDQNDYKVGPGRPPLHTRFRKGQSGNPGGRRKELLLRRRQTIHSSFVAGLVPWAFSPRTLIRGHPRLAAPELQVCVDARHKAGHERLWKGRII
jgi:hypothetical protein